MSSLSPDCPRARHVASPGIAALFAVVGLVAVPAQAAQYTVQPKVEVTAENNSNRDLLPSTSRVSSSQGYYADVGVTFGINTPRSTSTVRPRLRYQDYPERSDLNALEGMLDFYSECASERGWFNLYGQYEHRDAYNADLTDARFNDLNPDIALPDDDGRVGQSGITRASVYLTPQYVRQLTERVDLGFSAVYQSVDYSSGVSASGVSYGYTQGKVFVSREWSPLSAASIAAYASRYSASDLNRDVDDVGVTVGYDYKWSPAYSMGISVSGERAKTTDRTTAVAFSDTSSEFGAALVLKRKGQRDALRLELGRSMTPSTAGGVYRADQIQLQYDYSISQRLELRSAALHYRQRAVASVAVGGDHDYLNAESVLRWSASRTWFVAGGPRYVWTKSARGSVSAKNTSVFISFGYQGIAR